MHTCIPSHRIKRSWHSCLRWVNAGNKNTPSMHHPRRRNVVISVVGLKMSYTQKCQPKWWTQLAGEREEEEVLICDRPKEAVCYYEIIDCCKSYTNLVQGLQTELTVMSYSESGPERSRMSWGSLSYHYCFCFKVFSFLSLLICPSVSFLSDCLFSLPSHSHVFLQPPLRSSRLSKCFSSMLCQRDCSLTLLDR